MPGLDASKFAPIREAEEAFYGSNQQLYVLITLGKVSFYLMRCCTKSSFIFFKAWIGQTFLIFYFRSHRKGQERQPQPTDPQKLLLIIAKTSVNFSKILLKMRINQLINRSGTYILGIGEFLTLCNLFSIFCKSAKPTSVMYLTFCIPFEYNIWFFKEKNTTEFLVRLLF